MSKIISFSEYLNEKVYDTRHDWKELRKFDSGIHNGGQDIRVGDKVTIKYRMAKGLVNPDPKFDGIKIHKITGLTQNGFHDVNVYIDSHNEPLPSDNYIFTKI